MKIIKNEVKHYREAIVHLDRLDLERIIALKAQQLVQFDGACEVSIVELTEGSPAYKIGYGATVKIIEDLTK